MKRLINLLNNLVNYQGKYVYCQKDIQHFFHQYTTAIIFCTLLFIVSGFLLFCYYFDKFPNMVVTIGYVTLTTLIVCIIALNYASKARITVLNKSAFDHDYQKVVKSVDKKYPNALIEDKTQDDFADNLNEVVYFIPKQSNVDVTKKISNQIAVMPKLVVKVDDNFDGTVSYTKNSVFSNTMLTHNAKIEPTDKVLHQIKHDLINDLYVHKDDAKVKN